MTEEDPLAWARERMPIHDSLAREYGQRSPLDGYTVAVATHLETTTGVFIETLHEAGADVLVAPSEPRSTHADVVEHLDSHDGIETFADAEMDDDQFADAQHTMLEERPDLVLDDGCELIAKLHMDHEDVAEDVVGGAEQTTAGITRLEAMDEEGVLAFPVYGVNEAPMKHRFDNVHGTGESALTNIASMTNSVIAGKTVVVAGYGYVGRGIARKARALGANTIVTEVDPRRALEAQMDGHQTMEMSEAATDGELFITATGTRDILRGQHFASMPDGATICNAGHFDVEIDVSALESLAHYTSEPKPGVTRYHLPYGRHINLLSDGRLVNLTGPNSEGHPAEVMDITFALIFEAACALPDADLDAGLYALPDRLDRAVADRKLETMDVSIDDPTDEQQAYDHDWREGF